MASNPLPFGERRHRGEAHTAHLGGRLDAPRLGGPLQAAPRP